MATITIALMFVATSVLMCATVSHSTDPQQEQQHNATSGESQQEPWTPVLTSKQDGGASIQQYLDPAQQVLLIAPNHASSPAEEQGRVHQMPARGEVLNTDPLQPPQPTLQQAGSGVVLQIHPQYLKGYPANQNVHNTKHVQGGGGSNVGNGFNRNPHLAGTQLALQIQPQFVLTGVHNPGLLPKQVQTPLYYNQPLTYQNQLKPIQLAPPSPTVLAQLAAAQYPQLFQPTQHVKVPTHPTGIRGTQQNALVQHPVVKPTEEATKLRNHVRDTSDNEAFPDFGKMFESFFKSGPFGESFRNDNPENVEATNLKIHTNDDFPTGDFFGDLDKTKAASTNQQQQGDGQFQPCDFFKAANQKVVENDDNDDLEQFSSEKRAAREPSHFGQTRGQQHGPRDNEDSPRTKHQGERERYRGNRDDDDENKRPSHFHRHEERPHRHHSDDEDEEEPSRHRPSQSQRSEQRPKKESDDEDDDDADKRPANFHHHHNHDGYSRKPSSQRHNSGGSYGRPSQEHKNGDNYGRPAQEHKNGGNYGRPVQEHRSLGSYGQPSQEQRNGGNYGRPSQEHKSLGSYGQPSKEYNNGGHSARASNQRPSSERHEESRPSYGHHNNNDDDDDDRSHRPGPDEHRARPSNSNKQGQEAPTKPASPPAIRTFHHYNFPPTPDYVREASNHNKRPAPQAYSREPNNQNKQPSPIREPEDTIGYYTYVSPVVGNSDVYYLSEKQIIARNSSSTK